MASERDREIWDDATNAVCQAMQEQKMCNCPDGDCLAAKIDFSPEKIATATRPAPAATDTGLVTFSVEVTSSGHPYMKSDPDGDYVTRSQAEELLAAKDKTIALAETTMIEMHQDLNKLEADNAAQAARIKELDGECNELVTKCNEIIGQRDHALNACAQMEEDKEALEAKLAAANEVAQLVIQAEEDKSGDPNFYILLMQTAYDKARAVLGGKPS
ncbi:hypothetical protein [Brucella intermedia]